MILISFTTSCEEEEEVYSPKPRGYFRIEFPKKEYKLYDGDCPFSFEIPVYSSITPSRSKNAQPCWFNLEFPKYKATVYLDYNNVNNNMSQLLEDSRNFAVRHQVKSTGINESPVIRDSARVFGLLYDIDGNTASSVQFYLTDSTHHFLRGSLYFNASPNIDSLRLMVEFIREDILHLIKTTKWKTK